MYMINYMFLPPKLPCQDDSTTENETALLNTTIDALREFREHVTDDSKGAVDMVVAMVANMIAIGDTLDASRAVNERILSDVLRELPTKGGMIPLHIRAQNAGVMISKVADRIHVEVFELSPLNGPVLATKGRLRHSFPGFALALDLEVFCEPGLQTAMARSLAKMSHQSAPDTQPKVRKARYMHDENRDATHPKIVTELFMGFLRPMGEDMPVPLLWKNTREEVMWRDALLPWRRSPVWLLLRVSMQLAFSRLPDSERRSAEYYKSFMVFLMGKVLQMAPQCRFPCDLLYVMNAKLSRRLLKLDPSDSEAGVAVVHSIMHDTAKLIRTRWESVVQPPSSRYDLSVLTSLNFERDISTPLHDLAECLPLSVMHLDLPEQRHTNALVLEHLLRPENSVRSMPLPTRAGACDTTAESLLAMVNEMDPPAQVILDVGAQILELGNLEVAREWLKRTQDHEKAQAVVFFNDHDELSVLDRKGRVEPLQTSPFAARLDVCLVFLDEAHTRGTDLKLPEFYTAAVTLGAQLTKDRLIQACMRMRKLGYGQSVVFCVPKEIRRQILTRTTHSENTTTAIGVSDILCWAMMETWLDVLRSIPLWAVQGRRFEQQRPLWAGVGIDRDLVVSTSWAKQFLEDESQSLDHLYRGGHLLEAGRPKREYPAHHKLMFGVRQPGSQRGHTSRGTGA
ncbi:hypothetical protein A1O1_02740 [Capronia coronata CBS 617.96]|uniref:ubiquitinyl hydrolase 1 n=1 Tax=Capronia coronata CBS 617.96 TaxID=1182541 RepID=W9YYL0_9EURO|nr:uncharacterized protein A1O1_02740 [Capronia coronata CBS 617.96]EXJ94346.1 hypothetical protein A1O1_02740 [Capronia coronata CBS 617.96]